MPAMTWDENCADRSVANLPFKIETDRDGLIVMSPANQLQSRQKSVILAHHAEFQVSGYLLTGVAVATPRGVKVADVAWGSDTFERNHHNEPLLTAAPEIRVEIPSPAISAESTQEKLLVYFVCGAKEVWVCDELGRITFFCSPSRSGSSSTLFPDFPSKVLGKQQANVHGAGVADGSRLA